jgi:acyl carrier protein
MNQETGIIRKYIAEELMFSKEYAYPDNASFLNEGIIDSMNVLQLVLFVEKRFDLKVDDSEIVPENFDSVSQLARFVRSKVAVPTLA